jgi:hypothetical protein
VPQNANASVLEALIAKYDQMNPDVVVGVSSWDVLCRAKVYLLAMSLNSRKDAC